MAIEEIQQIRHQQADAEAFTGQDGVLTVDTTKRVVRVHDGNTPGGVPQAREDLANVAPASLTKRGAMDPTQVAKILANENAIITHATAIEGKQNLSEKNLPEGYAGLDADGKVALAVTADNAETADGLSDDGKLLIPELASENVFSKANAFSEGIRLGSATIRGKFAALSPRITNYINFDLSSTGSKTYSENGLAAVVSSRVEGSSPDYFLQTEIDFHPSGVKGTASGIPAATQQLKLHSSGVLEYGGKNLSPKQELRQAYLDSNSVQIQIPFAVVAELPGTGVPFRGLGTLDDLYEINGTPDFAWNGNDGFIIRECSLIDIEMEVRFSQLENNNVSVGALISLLSYLEFDGFTRILPAMPPENSEFFLTNVARAFRIGTFQNADAPANTVKGIYSYLSTSFSGRPTVEDLKILFTWKNVNVQAHDTMQIKLATTIPQSYAGSSSIFVTPISLIVSKVL